MHVLAQDGMHSEHEGYLQIFRVPHGKQPELVRRMGMDDVDIGLFQKIKIFPWHRYRQPVAGIRSGERREPVNSVDPISAVIPGRKNQDLVAKVLKPAL